jgi:protein AFG1
LDCSANHLERLPDRAANKILSNLLTAFFQLGGVLIASSNRMPDELLKASGINYGVPSRRGIVRNWLGLHGSKERNVFLGNNEYAGFVEVLKARCDIIEILGARDWRRREIEEMDAGAEEIAETMRGEMVAGLARHTTTSRLYDQSEPSKTEVKVMTPKKYLLFTTDSEEAWKTLLHSAFLSHKTDPIRWESMTIFVYGREIPVPRHLEGVCSWTFSELCEGTFGPADFITLASTFRK